MGNARLTMEKELRNEKGTYYLPSFKDSGNRKAQVKPETSTSYPHHVGLLPGVEVDAFSSDAIPVHLITREAIETYVDKLTHDGVLCCALRIGTSTLSSRCSRSARKHSGGIGPIKTQTATQDSMEDRPGMGYLQGQRRRR